MNNMNSFDEFDEIFSSLSEDTRVRDDNELHKTDEESMAKHSHEYDKLLTSYTSFIEKTLQSKREMKETFFKFSMIVMYISSIVVALSIIAIIVCYFFLDIDFKELILTCATAVTSFLTVFIVIPQIIAKYLFNSSEESIMKDIVAGIQEYDKVIREKLKK